MANALQKHGVFTSVVPPAQASGKPDLEFEVAYAYESDSHELAEFMDDMFVGLSLGVASWFMKEDFDYSVSVSGTLSHAGKEIGHYEGTGAYNSQVEKIVAENLPLRRELVRKAVELSWEHALREIAVRLKQDRARIVEALQK